MSRLFLLSLALVVVGSAGLSSAQDPVHLRRDHAAAENEISSGSIAPTPDMWYYQHELKRHDDPKMAVRRRAEQRAQERHERLASREWYGISNSRPAVSVSPQFGGYSAFWGSNTYDTLRWRAAPAPVIVTR